MCESSGSGTYSSQRSIDVGVRVNPDQAGLWILVHRSADSAHSLVRRSAQVKRRGEVIHKRVITTYRACIQPRLKCQTKALTQGQTELPICQVLRDGFRDVLVHIRYQSGLQELANRWIVLSSNPRGIHHWETIMSCWIMSLCDRPFVRAAKLTLKVYRPSK